MTLLIPSKRLKWLPKDLRLAHEYCFFLHDELARMLIEYEAAQAHIVTIKFRDKAEKREFTRLEKTHDPVGILRALGRHSEARRVVLNTITMAMVSDCAHHIYESLRCFEKRKVVPAFSLLRKPLLDSLMYFSWMVADEDDFYSAFTSGDPAKIAPKVIGNRRKEIFRKAIPKTDLAGIVEPEDVLSIIFDVGNPDSLYGLFQHAVHLVTVERVEIRTSPENFNFIFKNHADDDLYQTVYLALPIVLLYMTHLVLALYERITPMDSGAKAALVFRSINGLRYLQSEGDASALADAMNDALSNLIVCNSCNTPLKVTQHNAARLLLTDSFRCTRCKRTNPFPLSWIF